MSPTAYISMQLRQQIYYHLDNDLTQNALFLAGRLHGLEPRSADAAHLLALCHLRLGRLKAAYDYSRDKGSRGHHLGCAYVFAQAALGLDRHADGIGALERARGFWAGRNHWNKHSETSRRHIPDAAAICCLLGKLWKAHGDIKKAAECYEEALKINPFMWDAFLDLCNSGAAPRPSKIFQMTPDMLVSLSHSSAAGNGSLDLHTAVQPAIIADKKLRSVVTPGNDPFNPAPRTGAEPGLNLGGSNLLSRLNGSKPPPNAGSGFYQDAETPIGNVGNSDDDITMSEVTISVDQNAVQDAPHAPIRKARQVQSFVNDSGVEVPRMKPITTRSRTKPVSESSEATDIPRPTTQLAHKRTISGHASQASTASIAESGGVSQRRSTRILNRAAPTISRISAAVGRDPDAKEKREQRKAVKATGTRGRTGTTSTVGRVVSGNRKPVIDNTEDKKETRIPREREPIATVASQPAKQPAIDSARENEALQWLLDLLAKLGSGHFYLSRYQTQAALQAFNSVPLAQRETPWVMAQIAKAHYEGQAFTQADEMFRKIKKMCPSRMEDMEVYSTVLWHQRKETELAYLSHELIEADRLSPEAWCTIGNSFSLQREHERAIKCFKRATQLDSKFAYAFTLQGHEHVANEEYDKAQYAYRCAIAAEPRHYNGWYGLGKVSEKMGKFEVAEKYYKAAAQINPTNSILVVRIGVVLERMKKTQAALVQFAHAVELDPRLALPRFKKAHALMKLRHLKEALAELEVLKDLAPDEANVHFMLGRVYKMLGKKTSAIRHFTIALNLDPKAAQFIKEAMESLESDDDDDAYDNESNDM